MSSPGVMTSFSHLQEVLCGHNNIQVKGNGRRQGLLYSLQALLHREISEPSPDIISSRLENVCE